MSRLAMMGGGVLLLGCAVAFGDVRLTLGIRETRNSTNAQIGDDGGTGNDHDCGCGIEWVGATSVSPGGAPQGVLVPDDGLWHTVTFDMLAGPVTPFSGEADGNLFALFGQGPIEHLAIASTGTAGPYQMYVDNIRNVVDARGGPRSIPLTSFEGTADGSEELFQEPGFVVPDGAPSTGANVVGFNQSVVTSADASDGNKSTLVEWTFADDSPDRWIRLSTWTRNAGDPNFLPFGSPLVKLPIGASNSRVVMDVRLVLVPEPATGVLFSVLGAALLRRRKWATRRA